MNLLFIENVGNLICPVSFDLGQTYNHRAAECPEWAR
jgi:Ni2+-binding GTPase involved in maturation of urease and hydrogenase